MSRPCDACADPNGVPRGWVTEHQDGYRVGVACTKCLGTKVLPTTDLERRRRLAMLRRTSTSQPPPRITKLIVIPFPSREVSQ